MTDMYSAPRPRRRLILLPVVLLFLIAVLWSGAWFWAAHYAGTMVDRFLAHEAAAGRRYACAERHIGGYPFRIEIRCDKPTADIAAAGGPLQASAESFLAVAQVYDPNHVIGELAGPLRIGRYGDVPPLEINFRLAEASLVGLPVRQMGLPPGIPGLPGEFERASLVIEAPVASSSESGTDQRILTADRLALHLRRSPGAPAGSYDVAASAGNLSSPALAVIGGGPLDADIRLGTTGITDLSPRIDAARLRGFADAGARLNVSSLRLKAPSFVAQGAGELGLDAQGRPAGRLDVTANGVQALLGSLMPRAGTFGGIVGAGLNFLGKPAELDGKPATTFQVTITDGDLRVGPLRLARFAPLY